MLVKSTNTTPLRIIVGTTLFFFLFFVIQIVNENEASGPDQWGRSRIYTDETDISLPGPSPNNEKAALEAQSRVLKTVVMGRIKGDDTNWAENLEGWRTAIYTADTPSSPPRYLSTPLNKGKEAMPYLTYIIDNYDNNLTPINVFVHSHGGGWPKAWHNEPDTTTHSATIMLQKLRIDNILAKGYVNLRCNSSPGCKPIALKPRMPDSYFVDGSIEPGFKSLWGWLFPGEPLPEMVAVACCAQFAVTADTIRKRPKEVYERARDWLVGTELGSEMSGRVFEYFWHILFGMEAVHCPEDHYTCICETWQCGKGVRGMITWGLD